MAIPYSKADQLKHNRKSPKRGVSGKFSPDTKRRIFERDNHQCVRCGTTANLEHTPHHVVYKSAMGKGTIDNGVTVCRSCHGEAHAKHEVREWFESYRLNHLLEAKGISI